MILAFYSMCCFEGNTQLFSVIFFPLWINSCPVITPKWLIVPSVIYSLSYLISFSGLLVYSFTSVSCLSHNSFLIDLICGIGTIPTCSSSWTDFPWSFAFLYVSYNYIRILIGNPFDWSMVFSAFPPTGLMFMYNNFILLVDTIEL